MTNEALILFCLTGVGAVCGCVFDFFRGLHAFMRKNDAAVIVTDVIFWAAVTAVVTYSLFRLNGITVHLYEIMGLILGAVLYFLALSRYVYAFFSLIIEKNIKIAKISAYILKILLTPARFLYKMVIAVVLKAKRFILKTNKKGANINEH